MGSDPYVGEIQMFAGTFVPEGWAACDGQLLAINGNDALFSLLGTKFGGDGRTTFGLPDLRGRVPVGANQGPGLTNRVLGHRFGAEQVALTSDEWPEHTHDWQATTAAASSTVPNMLAAGGKVYSNAATGEPLSSSGSTGVKPVGGGQPHDNIQPYLVINHIIALVGVYPSRN